MLPSDPVVSYTTFSPLRSLLSETARSVSVALSVPFVCRKASRPVRTGHPALWSPDFPPRPAQRTSRSDRIARVSPKSIQA